MSDLHDRDPLRDAWQSQEPKEDEMNSISIDALEKRAANFDRTITRRNLREFVAAGIAGCGSLFLAYVTPRWGARIGFLELALTAVFVTYRLQVSGRSVARTDDAHLSLVEHHRRSLARQIALLHRVWLWYLAPFALGFAITLGDGFVAQRGHLSGPYITTVALCVFVLVFAWFLNRRAEKKLRAELGALDRD